MKKLFFIFLSLVLIVCLSISVFAADGSFTWGKGRYDGYAMLSHTSSNPLANSDLKFRSVSLASATIRIANVPSGYSDLSYFNLLTSAELDALRLEAVKAGLNVTLYESAKSEYVTIAVTGWTSSFYSVSPPPSSSLYIGLLCSENGYVYTARKDGTTDNLTALIRDFKSLFNDFYNSTKWVSGNVTVTLGESMKRVLNKLELIDSSIGYQGTQITTRLDTLINKITELHNALVVDTPTDKNPGFLGIYNVLTKIDNNLNVNIESIASNIQISSDLLNDIDYWLQQIGPTLGGDVLSSLNLIVENTGLLRLEDIPQIKEAILSIPDTFDTVVTVSSNKIINKQDVIASRLDDIYFQLAEKNNSATIASDVALIRLVARNTYSSVDSIVTLLKKQAETKVENITNVTINEDNDAYDVFYLTGNDGEKEGIAVFGGRALKAGGKLLNFLFRICFDDAISGIDNTVNNLNNFYFDDSPVEGEGSIWD